MRESFFFVSFKKKCEGNNILVLKSSVSKLVKFSTPLKHCGNLGEQWTLEDSQKFCLNQLNFENQLFFTGQGFLC